MAKPDLKEWPTIKKLMKALREKNDPKLQPMIARARTGYYHDYLSPLATPVVQLVIDLREVGGHEDLIDRVMNGDFDATREESDRWAESEDGQETFRMLLEGIADRRREG
jgi:hypothetical protein